MTLSKSEIVRSMPIVYRLCVLISCDFLLIPIFEERDSVLHFCYFMNIFISLKIIEFLILLELEIYFLIVSSFQINLMLIFHF